MSGDDRDAGPGAVPPGRPWPGVPNGNGEPAPGPVTVIAAGRVVREVRENETGGRLFEVGTGPGRCFVKWTPAGSGIDLGLGDRWAGLAIATRGSEWNYGPGWDRLLLDAYGVPPDPEHEVLPAPVGG